MKRTTGRKVARTLVPKKELKSAKRQKDTEEETCQCLVSDEQFGNSRSGEKWVVVVVVVLYSSNKSTKHKQMRRFIIQYWLISVR